MLPFLLPNLMLPVKRLGKFICIYWIFWKKHSNFIFSISSSLCFLFRWQISKPMDTIITRQPRPNPNPRANIFNKSKGIVAMDLYKSAFLSSIVTVSSTHITGNITLPTSFMTLISSICRTCTLIWKQCKTCYFPISESGQSNITNSTNAV